MTKLKPVFNPFTGKLDFTVHHDEYLKIDQTTPQTVINGAPIFNEGLVIKAGAKIIFDG